MRRDRDLEWLWQRAQARDPLGCKFFDGIGKWLEKCRKAMFHLTYPPTTPSNPERFIEAARKAKAHETEGGASRARLQKHCFRVCDSLPSS